jgi:hypothetical protein
MKHYTHETMGWMMTKTQAIATLKLHSDNRELKRFCHLRNQSIRLRKTNPLLSRKYERACDMVVAVVTRDINAFYNAA